ncbi:GNAT family N-acetyltransferase [Acutalibacter caecimuris]|uniref:GNAT family N-acetyltransferase n=1 Tax=Acutalibacter caecimuris TaxID=3093657 RepID=UPI002AC8FA9D|nr:GNAT family N-acetyltransferase [Acutalibacter sp. M00118]
MRLRAYASADCPALAELFYQTVHAVNARDYTPRQLDAWATGQVDLAAWDRSFREHFTLVAEEKGEIVGFGDIDRGGYLDRLYVHKDYQGRGVATALCQGLERAVGTGTVVTHASVTAKGFFLRRGYRVCRAQQVERRGVWLRNFVMEKILGPPAA